MASKAKRKSKANTNALGDPLTVYITDAQKNKLQRMADRKAKQTGGKFSLTAMIRNLIDAAPERESE